jgi:hypothetical protein
MRRPEKEYGSEYRLWKYFYSSKRCDLDAAIIEAIGYHDCSLSWVYPDEANDPRIRETIHACHLSLGLALPGERDKLRAHELGKRGHEVAISMSGQQRRRHCSVFLLSWLFSKDHCWSLSA